MSREEARKFLDQKVSEAIKRGALLNGVFDLIEYSRDLGVVSQDEARYLCRAAGAVYEPVFLQF